MSDELGRNPDLAEDQACAGLPQVEAIKGMLGGLE
eukprot:CAMPEP_0170591684 /NCGR_PEP_ID=MMETSP0224-20130122/12530_1 /TAXON_ID=285029 /ORGANISM="Togula jolla, Strain CCCM 725" /LENGTH=34 /DNA_ID= /DNA_START= /DNA_END= /DNA_ORIENTATION=